MYTKPRFALTLFICLALLAPCVAQAQVSSGADTAAGERGRVPRLVKFGDTLRDAQGAPRRGVAGVTFAIYAEREGGVPLWQEAQNVALDADGRYSVLLGATSREGLPAELFASGEPRWLGVRVDAPGDVAGSTEQARVLLVSVPYALHAADAETLGGRAAADFVLRDELAGWSGVIPGAADSPRAVGGTQGIAVDATGSPNRIPRVQSATGALITYTDGLFFDDGNGIGLGTSSPVALLDLQLTTAVPRDTLSAAVTLNNAAPIPGAVVTPFRMTLNDQSTATNLSKQAMRVIYDRNVGATGGVSVFDSAITLATFIRSNAPYTYRALNVEGPRIFNGQTLQTLFGIFIEAPPANVGGQPAGAITNKFAIVTAPGSGNVGFGTTAPLRPLTVAGQIESTLDGYRFPDGTVQTTAAFGVPGGSGDITDVNTPAGGGLQGGSNLGPANLRMIDCGASQVLKYISATWQCAADADTNSGGTVTSLTSGTGLAGGTITTSGTLSLDTAFTDTRYLQLAGGTLTGALNGTSATFSAAVTGLTGSFSSRLIARGTLEAATLGTATNGTGFNSASQVFFYSAFDSDLGLGTAVQQDFRWIASPQGNNTPTPTGFLKLQWNPGAGAADTGLSIANTGIITFAPGQTFPGGGGGGVTQVDSGAGLTGGPITSTGTLAVDFTQTQARVGSSCPIGQSIRVINQNGTVTCEVDDGGAGGGGTVSQVDTGLGLTGGPVNTVGTIAIDTAVVPLLGVSNTFTANNIFSGSNASPIVEVTQNGTTNAISGIYNGSTAFTSAIRGNATSPTSNRVHGVEGITNSTEPGAAGVRGVATNVGSVAGVGVLGFANGTAGNGVQGVAGAASGATLGVAGIATASPGGIGASGEGGLMGVYGRSLSPTGPGGRFQNSSTGPILQGLNSASAVVFSVAGSGATSATGFFHTGGRIAGLLPTCTAGQVMKVNGGGTDWQCDTDLTSGGGSVSITQGTGITASPNPITGTGTVSLDTTFTDGRYLRLTGGTLSGALNLPANGLVAGTNQLVLFNGSVGIGSSTPNGPTGTPALHISGSTTPSLVLEQNAAPSGRWMFFTDASQGGLVIRNGPLAGTDRVYIGPTGNVGIGVVFPTDKLDVAGTARIGATVRSQGYFNMAGVDVGLRTDCGANEIMKWSGTAWACALDQTSGGGGSVSITQGTGIIATPNPITGSGTVAIDTTVVPRLNVANSFNQLNSFLGGLNVTSVSASSASISASSANPLLQIAQTGSTRALDVSYSGTANNSFAVQVSASANTTNVVTGIYASTNSSSGGAIGILGEAVNAAGPGTGVAGSSTGAGGAGVQGFANANSGSTTGVGGTATASTSGVGVRGTGGFLGVFGISSSATGGGGRFQNTGTGPLLQGLNSASSTVFSVAQNGAVTSSGSVTANGYFQSNGRIAGLLPTCTGSQIMKMNPGGTDWQCDSDQGGGGGSGDVTDVLAGTGITVTNGAGPQPSVAIDTTVVPRLGVSNTFTAANTFNGAVTVGSSNLTVDTNTLFVDAINNRVGIGTSSPAKELHIVGGANTGFTLESSASNGNPTLTVKANSPAGHAAVVIDRADTGAPAQLVFSTGGTSNWRLWSPVGVFDRLDFANASNVATMTFLQSGNVGIGVTNPLRPLAVAGVIESTTGGFRFPDGTTQTTAATGGGGSGDLTDILAGTGISVLNGAGPSPAVSIDTTVVPRMNVVNTFTANQIFNTNLTVDTNTLFVDSVNNRLGVGTLTPTAKIQVVNDSITVVPFSARAVASQTAPMALWQDSGGNFLTSITVDGHLSTLGVVDLGSWAGTTESPTVTEPATGTTNVFEGLVVRRINTAIVNAGTVVASTDALQFERDGTNGGFVVRLVDNARRQNVQCSAVPSVATTPLVARNDLSSGALLTTYAVYSNAENVLSIHCMIGNPENQGHHAEISLHRAPGSGVWVGTVTSTFNQ